MEFNEYQVAANRTLYGNEQVLTNCALGLAGESGQLIDLVKDYTFKGKDLDREKLVAGMFCGIYLRSHNGQMFLLMRSHKRISIP